ncbi:hypothetical protein [Candidatus Laterigemmans baculatus]|uniref:hypothetical protein n=1 Tax=Candidatus Laterigemmans baculatus TaxID=2770505 RepID=UPI00193F1A91|nr:hypothetical protein [Candidatus Laterigemmans baculatus]
MKQARAIHGLRKAGAAIGHSRDVRGKQMFRILEYVVPDDLLYDISSISIRGDSFMANADQFSRILPKIGGYHRLVIKDIPVDRQLLRHIATERSLEQLWIIGADLTDEDLVSLGGLKCLESLNLSRNPLRNLAPLELGSLPVLQELQLDSTRVTGGDLDFIAGSSVDYLSVRNTRVTFETFGAMRRPNSLKTLFVDDDFATPATIRSIESASDINVILPSGPFEIVPFTP